MTNFNENGIIVLSQDNLPVLANQIAEIVVNEMSRSVDGQYRERSLDFSIDYVLIDTGKMTFNTAVPEDLKGE